MPEKMPRLSFWAHCKYVSEFERGRIIGLKEEGQRADPAFTIIRPTGPQLQINVWGSIPFDSRIPLVVNRYTLTAQRYVDDILRTVLLPFFLPSPGLIFQQDNARPHTTRATVNYLTACQTFPGPARSPDFIQSCMSGM
ncbi:transposable element Tc1 transposase [Trichonephila clavipes]|nr:transposable element Tc1 transposase [Trichonephila clavipes]